MKCGRNLSHSVFFSGFALVAVLACVASPTAIRAANSVVVESKTFSPGQTACTVGVFITNDVPVAGIILPFELRTTLGDAYPYVSSPTSFRFRLSPGNRIDLSPLGSAGENWPAPITVVSYFAQPYSGSGYPRQCSGPLSRTYDDRSQSIDGESPDAVFYAAISIGDPNAGEEWLLQPGVDSEATEHASFVFVFELSDGIGCFRIDTCCVSPSNHLSMTNADGDLIDMKFTRGIIAVGETNCPGSENPATNTPPIARCRDSIEILVGAECVVPLPSSSDIDAGSYDAEDGTNLQMFVKSRERLTPGRGGVVMAVCDQDAVCVPCTTIVFVRDTMPQTVSVEIDSLYFYFSDSMSASDLCHDVALATTGCSPWVNLEVNGLIDIVSWNMFSPGPWTACVSRALASNAPAGVYEGHVVLTNINSGYRDTVIVTIEVNHPAGVLLEPACDTIRGFTLRPTGEPVEGASVRVVSCLSDDDRNCGRIPGVVATSGPDGSFVIATKNFSHVWLEAYAQGRYASTPIRECENVPIYLYMRDGYGGVSGNGSGQPDTVPCLASGFVRHHYDSDSLITPVAASVVELWDTYPFGTRVSVDTSDGYGHFGPWMRGGMLVAKAGGYCPTILENIRCDDQPTFVSVQRLDLNPIETVHYDDFNSLSAMFGAYPVQYGDVITATDPQGTVCGIRWIEGSDSDHIRVFGDDPRTIVDEGAQEGDSIALELNCRFPIFASRIWHNIGDPIVEFVAELPREYMLEQNYPNPFNAGTTMSFDLKDEAEWSLAIYNIVGQRVRLFTGQDVASRVRVQWDGKSESGLELASGVYFYRVTANEFTATKKMMVLK